MTQTRPTELPSANTLDTVAEYILPSGKTTSTGWAHRKSNRASIEAIRLGDYSFDWLPLFPFHAITQGFPSRWISQKQATFLIGHSTGSGVEFKMASKRCLPTSALKNRRALDAAKAAILPG
jgi:hypothetical protein